MTFMKSLLGFKPLMGFGSILECFHFKGQTQLICCFSDLSRTHLKELRRIKIKGKRGKILHENTIICGKKFYFSKIILNFPFHQCTEGSEKQQINWVWPKVCQSLKFTYASLYVLLMRWLASSLMGQVCIVVYQYSIGYYQKSRKIDL